MLALRDFLPVQAAGCFESEIEVSSKVSMRICQLGIRELSRHQNREGSLPDHSVLFGPNDVGKSMSIEALALLFERERLTRQVSDSVFHGGSPKPESRFFIIGTITDFADTTQRRA